MLNSCPACHRTLGEEDAYCAGCGTAVEVRGHDNDPSSRAADQPVADPPADHGFADATGEGRDTEHPEHLPVEGPISRCRSWFHKQSTQRQTLIAAGSIAAVVLALGVLGGTDDQPTTDAESVEVDAAQSCVTSFNVHVVPSGVLVGALGPDPILAATVGEYQGPPRDLTEFGKSPDFTLRDGDCVVVAKRLVFVGRGGRWRQSAVIPFMQFTVFAFRPELGNNAVLTPEILARVETEASWTFTVDEIGGSPAGTATGGGDTNDEQSKPRREPTELPPEPVPFRSDPSSGTIPPIACGSPDEVGVEGILDVRGVNCDEAIDILRPLYDDNSFASGWHCDFGRAPDPYFLVCVGNDGALPDAIDAPKFVGIRPTDSSP